MISQIPVIMVEGKTLPEVWERAVLDTWEKGIAIRTEYDKPEDPASRDCTMVMVIDGPMSEPRIHRAFPGSLEDLEVYRQEVVDGIHDQWINPDEGKWTYTYHQRIFNYPAGKSAVDQIGSMVDKLASVPHTRRAQAITWDPSQDPVTDDPPCLQRIWCRLVQKGADRYSLAMNAHWRSRDAFKASFMNMYALTDLQRLIASRLQEKMKRPVEAGRYVDISDSFHIYGSYAVEFQNFLDLIKKRTFEERTWVTKFAQPFFEDAKRRLLEERARAR